MVDADDRCKPIKQIRFKTALLQSDLCDCSDEYIVVKGKIFVKERNNIDRINRSLAFKTILDLLAAYQRSIICNFIGKLDENNGAKMFFIIEKAEETT